MFLTLKYLLLTSNILGFVSSQNSPKLFCPKNRSFDIDAIYSVIDDAKQYVYIAVTDYLPISSTSSKRSGTFRPVPCGPPASGLWDAVRLYQEEHTLFQCASCASAVFPSCLSSPGASNLNAQSLTLQECITSLSHNHRNSLRKKVWVINRKSYPSVLSMRRWRGFKTHAFRERALLNEKAIFTVGNFSVPVWSHSNLEMIQGQEILHSSRYNNHT